jgi:hypothetical protein
MSPSSPVAATPSSAKVTDNVLWDVPDFGLNSATAMLSGPGQVALGVGGTAAVARPGSGREPAAGFRGEHDVERCR